MIFDWHTSQMGGQSVIMQHDNNPYWLLASPVGIKSYNQQFQALCNCVRISKDLYATLAEAKIACEEWYKREVLGEQWDAEKALCAILYEHTAAHTKDIDCDYIAKDILSHFTIAPKR